MKRSAMGVIAAALLVLLATPPFARQSVAQEPTDRERFELLHDSMAALSADYVDDVLKTIAFLLLAIGWILTSDRSRAFLTTNRGARRAALLTIPALALLHVGWSFAVFRVSQRKLTLLVELGYLPLAYYADDRITALFFAANLLVHVVLFATLFALVQSLARYSTSLPQGR